MQQRPIQLFCDAAGNPPHLGAVLFCDGNCLWTHCAAPPAVVKHFYSRKDNQIMGLELLAIALGLSTFVNYLRGRKVIVHSDNTGSEVRLICFSRIFVMGCVRSGNDAQRNNKTLGPRPAGPCAVAVRGQTRNTYSRQARGDGRQHCRPTVKTSKRAINIFPTESMQF